MGFFQCETLGAGVYEDDVQRIYKLYALQKLTNGWEMVEVTLQFTSQTKASYAREFHVEILPKKRLTYQINHSPCSSPNQSLDINFSSPRSMVSFRFTPVVDT